MRWKHVKQYLTRTPLNSSVRHVISHTRVSCLWNQVLISPLIFWPLTCAFSTPFAWSGIVSQTKETKVLSLKWRAARKQLPVCTARCGQRRGHGLLLLMSVWTEHREGCLRFTSPGAITRNCFLDPSVVKSENVLRAITQANTMSQDKYAILVSKPEMKQKQVFPILGLIAYMRGWLLCIIALFPFFKGHDFFLIF